MPIPADFTDKKLTENFSLKEFLFSAAMPEESWPLNWEAYKANKNNEQENVQKIAEWMQKNIRDRFKKSVKINSGLRAKAWELLRKRSGNSQHVKGWACDFLVSGLSSNEHLALFKELATTHPAGVAICKRSGKVVFIHVDLWVTSPARRWEY